MKILFYGNCQTSKLSTSCLFESFEKQTIQCFDTDITQNTYTSIIKEADVIITQPIKSDYRDKTYLGTDYIYKHRRGDSKLIIIPSIFGGVYFPDATYMENKSNSLIHIPSDYHYLNLIKYYINQKTPTEFYDEIVNNSDYIATDELLSHIDNTVNILHTKEKTSSETYPEAEFITVSGYITSNWRDKLLFDTMNHPTHHIYNFILKHIVALGIVNTTREIKNNKHFFPNHRQSNRSLMYKSVKDQVDFDTSSYTPRINDIDTPTLQLIELYFKTYNEHGVDFETFNYRLKEFTYRDRSLFY